MFSRWIVVVPVWIRDSGMSGSDACSNQLTPAWLVLSVHLCLLLFFLLFSRAKLGFLGFRVLTRDVTMGWYNVIASLYVCDVTPGFTN